MFEGLEHVVFFSLVPQLRQIGIACSQLCRDCVKMPMVGFEVARDPQNMIVIPKICPRQSLRVQVPMMRTLGFYMGHC